MKVLEKRNERRKKYEDIEVYSNPFLAYVFLHRKIISKNGIIFLMRKYSN
jgi:hypothetical protein